MENMSIKELVETVDEKSFKQFFLRELRQNKELEEKFKKEFSNKKLINEKYYKDKLDNIIECGKLDHFEAHGIYSLEPITIGLTRFMQKDIDNLIKIEAYDTVISLLKPIADILNQDATVNRSEWYDLYGEYEEIEDRLIGNLMDSEDEKILNTLPHLKYR